MIDIAQDPVTGDLLMTPSGDIQYVESTRQHQNDILLATKGEYRLNPTGTVGLIEFLDDTDVEGLQREIRVQLGKDGMKINSIAVTGDGKINISAAYE